jgi:hypothetical protein
VDYHDQKLVPHESIPGIVRIVCNVRIQKEGPLIAADLDLATVEFLFNPSVKSEDGDKSGDSDNVRVHGPVHTSQTE